MNVRPDVMLKKPVTLQVLCRLVKLRQVSGRGAVGRNRVSFMVRTVSVMSRMRWSCTLGLAGAVGR